LIKSRIAWRPSDHAMSVTFWRKNLLNTAYLKTLDSQANGDFGRYAPPRTFGATFKCTF
jgi:outer membrane receptor protein involved in Fe transport